MSSFSLSSVGQEEVMIFNAMSVVVKFYGITFANGSGNSGGGTSEHLCKT